MESHARTIVKSLTWRFVALVITTGVAWLVIKKIEVAASIGLVDTLIKLVAYYGHERAWLKIKFGKLQRPEYEI